MAQGGGRGWFHRKRPQPSPDEPVGGTTHVRSTPPTVVGPSPEAVPQADPTPARDSQQFAEWSPEVRLGAPTAGSDSASAAVRQYDSGASSAVEPTAVRVADSEDATSTAPRPGHEGPSGRETTELPEVAPAHESVSRSIDWDAATAAALTADVDPAETTAEHHSTGPDRLLEDLIREIVGDATADTASALHPTRTAPTGTAESTHDSEGAPANTSLAPEAAAPQGSAPEIAEVAVTPTAVVQHPAPPEVPAIIAPATPSVADAPPVAESAPPVAPSTAPVAPHEPTEAPDVSRETSSDHGGTPLAYELADETRRRNALDEAVLPLPPSTRVLTISNQKGGVGKTTTAVNLAAGLARAGARVLVIDLDPQGNASTALGVDHRSERKSVYEVLVSDVSLAEVVQPSTEHELLDCVPATIHLAGAEIELVSLVAREQRLRRALDAHLATMDRPYDYVFIDCPPSLGLLTINAFVAAREVLIPIQCEYYALEGLSQLLSNIELIEKHLNPELRLSTILLTMYDSRTNLAQQVAQEVRDHFPVQTLETIIPRSVRVSEAPSYGQSVISYDFGSTGSLSYREAAAEIARRGAATPEESN
ncbi:Cellulose biosynthesis protein BcsQ [Agromyces cerinus subsp. cerinus]|uniref:Cellulose biosynthesis protein BcsQ n=1 Tax=Agromyces cerinus subsp. cerinus TaxID=232089 RepID=A0A1N6G3G3_9MICO|nr:Cellulose biosynthesis protein BcsQ [Agromyces cerinus subsp. cerinus]